MYVVNQVGQTGPRSNSVAVRVRHRVRPRQPASQPALQHQQEQQLLPMLWLVPDFNWIGSIDSITA